jgi:UDP-N-acetylglucosamine:LPS N-acetylglucosamine transferase
MDNPIQKPTNLNKVIGSILDKESNGFNNKKIIIVGCHAGIGKTTELIREIENSSNDILIVHHNPEQLILENVEEQLSKIKTESVVKPFLIKKIDDSYRLKPIKKSKTKGWQYPHKYHS